MKLLETILVATDFSPSADDAVRVAAGLARAFGARVVLLYVMPELPEAGVAEEMLREKSGERLEEIAGRVRAAGVGSVAPAVAAGDPGERILEQAEAREANLIFIGSGQKPHDDRFPLGIIAARICRLATKPVWVVKPGAPDQAARILCAVDFSDTSRRALTNVIHLARTYQAELIVLTVVAPLSSWLGTADHETQDAHLADERARFAEFLKEFDFHGVSHQAVLRQGEPHEEILAAVAEASTDLLVMGSVGRTGLSRALMGSVAEKVTRQMPCSIVTVKAEHAIRLRLEAQIADLHARFKQGQELLENGFPAEAERAFRRCIGESSMYAPAWEGLAAAQQRQGRQAEAEESRRQARQIVQMLWDRQVEAEIRSHHLLWRK
jgi:universal stress protein E